MTEQLTEKMNDSNLSVERASEMFSALFEDAENQWIVAELFKWLPWMAREKKVQETIQMAKWWLQDLKSTIV